MLQQPIEIVAVIRQMRGGSQSYLVRGSDGFSYVAKFRDNPQGNKTLINECIASRLLKALRVTTPDLAILRLGDDCDGRSRLYYSKQSQEPIANGLHLGSRCPANPEAVAIFDLLPRTLYHRIANLQEVGVVFAFDCWVAHRDHRQFIFARVNKRAEARPTKQKGLLFTAWAIDNGMCFGKKWKFFDNPLWKHDIYSYCDLEQTAVYGAHLIQSLPSSAFTQALEGIPCEWFEMGERVAAHHMIDALEARRVGLNTTIYRQIAAASESRSQRKYDE